MAPEGADNGPCFLNGIPILPEEDPLRVDMGNLAPFSLPSDALEFVPPSQAVVYAFKSGDKERKIYLNVEMTKEEQEQLKQLVQMITERKKSFSPTVASMATRYLSRARGDPQKALQLMEDTQKWRADFFKIPLSDDSVIEDMKHGICYFCGRDYALRPIIVVRAIRIPQQWYKEKRVDKLLRILIFNMEYMLRYMVVPGRVENNCLIVDLKGLSLSQVPIGALKDVYKVMSHHYICRVFKFFVCNMSTTLSTIVGMVKGLLTDRQKQKLVFVNDVKELRSEFALHQIEEDLGGSLPVFKEFFPFPLRPGPFNAGYDKGPDKDATPGCHDLLTREGARGRIWDLTKRRDENLGLVYSGTAPDIYARCDLPMPPQCLKQARLTETGEDQPLPPVPDTPEPRAGGRAVEEEPKNPMPVVMEDAWTGKEGKEDDKPMNIKQDQVFETADDLGDSTTIRPAGIFSCMPCKG